MLGRIMDTPAIDKRGTRSPVVAGVTTAVCVTVCCGFLAAVLNAFLTGRTRFPAKWNDIYVTWAANPGWFIASVIALLLIAAVMARASIVCGKHFLRLIRDRSSRFV
jgi:hypothetical protein